MQPVSAAHPLPLLEGLDRHLRFGQHARIEELAQLRGA